MKRLILASLVGILATASAEARPHLFGRRSQVQVTADQGACKEATPAKPQGSPTGQMTSFTRTQAAPPVQVVQTQAASGPRFPLLSRVFGTATGGGCANGACGR